MARINRLSGGGGSDEEEDEQTQEEIEAAAQDAMSDYVGDPDSSSSSSSSGSSGSSRRSSPESKQDELEESLSASDPDDTYEAQDGSDSSSLSQQEQASAAQNLGMSGTEIEEQTGADVGAKTTEELEAEAAASNAENYDYNVGSGGDSNPGEGEVEVEDDSSPTAGGASPMGVSAGSDGSIDETQEAIEENAPDGTSDMFASMAEHRAANAEEYRQRQQRYDEAKQAADDAWARGDAVAAFVHEASATGENLRSWYDYTADNSGASAQEWAGRGGAESAIRLIDAANPNRSVNENFTDEEFGGRIQGAVQGVEQDLAPIEQNTLEGYEQIHPALSEGDLSEGNLSDSLREDGYGKTAAAMDFAGEAPEWLIQEPAHASITAATGADPETGEVDQDPRLIDLIDVAALGGGRIARRVATGLMPHSRIAGEVVEESTEQAGRETSEEFAREAGERAARDVGVDENYVSAIPQRVPEDYDEFRQAIGLDARKVDNGATTNVKSADEFRTGGLAGETSSLDDFTSEVSQRVDDFRTGGLADDAAETGPRTGLIGSDEAAKFSDEFTGGIDDTSKSVDEFTAKGSAAADDATQKAPSTVGDLSGRIEKTIDDFTARISGGADDATAKGSDDAATRPMFKGSDDAAKGADDAAKAADDAVTSFTGRLGKAYQRLFGRFGTGTKVFVGGSTLLVGGPALLGATGFGDKGPGKNPDGLYSEEEVKTYTIPGELTRSGREEDGPPLMMTIKGQETIGYSVPLGPTERGGEVMVLSSSGSEKPIEYISDETAQQQKESFIAPEFNSQEEADSAYQSWLDSLRDHTTNLPAGDSALSGSISAPSSVSAGESFEVDYTVARPPNMNEPQVTPELRLLLSHEETQQSATLGSPQRVTLDGGSNQEASGTFTVSGQSSSGLPASDYTLVFADMRGEGAHIDEASFTIEADDSTNNGNGNWGEPERVRQLEHGWNLYAQPHTRQEDRVRFMVVGIAEDGTHVYLQPNGRSRPQQPAFFDSAEAAMNAYDAWVQRREEAENNRPDGPNTPNPNAGRPDPSKVRKHANQADSGVRGTLGSITDFATENPVLAGGGALTVILLVAIARRMGWWFFG